MAETKNVWILPKFYAKHIHGGKSSNKTDIIVLQKG